MNKRYLRRVVSLLLCLLLTASVACVSFAADGKPMVNLSGKKVCKLVKSGEDYLFYQGSDNLIVPKVYSDPEVSDSIQSVQTDYYTAEIAEDGSFDKITPLVGFLINIIYLTAAYVAAAPLTGKTVRLLPLIDQSRLHTVVVSCTAQMLHQLRPVVAVTGDLSS